MAINFPGSLDDTTSIPDPGPGNNTDAPSHAGIHDLENAAIRALEAKMGVGASTPIANRVFRGTGSGTSAWAQLVLSTDVTGTLPVANGGTGVTTSTGTGNTVLSSSPTLVTPTIADLTNAQHSHTNAAGGGTLNAANALQAGTVSFANLLSTIFSGQVTSTTNSGGAGGTMNYINLGGIRLAWGRTNSATATGTGNINASYGTVVYPTSFFTTIQSILLSLDTVGNTNYLGVNLVSRSDPTSFTPEIVQWSGTNGNASCYWFVIGT